MSETVPEETGVAAPMEERHNGTNGRSYQYQQANGDPPRRADHSPEPLDQQRPPSPAKSLPEQRRPASPAKTSGGDDNQPRSRLSRAEKLLLDLDADIERDRRRQGGGTAAAPREASASPPPMSSKVQSRTRALADDAAEAGAGPAAAAFAARSRPEQSPARAAPAAASLPDQQRLQRRVDDLLDENRRLQASLTRATAASAPSDSQADTGEQRPRLNSEESQRLLDKLLLDKETLTTEMQQLRLQLETVKTRSRSEESWKEQEQQQLHPGLPEFDPNNPSALKRRIADMEQQILDLQEANETIRERGTEQPSQRSQQPHQEQQQLPSWSPASDSRLKATVDELTVENRVLRNEVTRLRQKERPDISYVHDEVGGLRTEMDALREQNNQLRQESRRLMEQHGTTSGLHHQHRPLTYDGVTGSFGSLAGVTGGSSRQPVPQFEARSFQRYEAFERTPTAAGATATLDRHQRARSSRSGRHHQLDAGGASASETSWHKRPMPPPPPPLQLPLPLASANGVGGGVREDDSGDSTDTILTDVEREFECFDSGRVSGVGGFKHRSGEFASSSLYRSSGRPESPSGRQRQQRTSLGRHNRSTSSSAIDRPQRYHEDAGIGGTDGAGSSPFSTLGRHPFAPKRHSDIRPGDMVKFTRQGGRISKGLVHYIGRLPGRNDVYIGVELDHEEGKHDGVYDGRRYFQCKSHKGVFVAFNKLIMCYQTK